MKWKVLLSMVIAVAIAVSFARAGDYNISRSPDGPFSFSISGVDFNPGSTMQRESVLFNEPSCPVQITSHSLSIIYEDRGFRFSGTTGLEVSETITAIQVRTALYDVFGQHMQNLANIEPRDMAIGSQSISGKWRAGENDISELLTTVTYIARVRLADGTQWVCSFDDLHLALSSLHLEKKIGEDDDDK